MWTKLQRLWHIDHLYVYLLYGKQQQAIAISTHCVHGVVLSEELGTRDDNGEHTAN